MASRPAPLSSADLLADSSPVASCANTEVLVQRRFGGWPAFMQVLQANAWTETLIGVHDDGGRLAAWSLCLPFHGRPGYAGSTLLMFSAPRIEQPDVGLRSLLLACEQRAGSMGATSLITFAAEPGTARDDWLLTQGFSRAGHMALAGDIDLRGFFKRLETKDADQT